MAEETHIRPWQPADWPAIDQIVRRIWNIGLDYLREKRYGFQVGGRPWQERKSQAIHHEILAGPRNWYVTECDGRVIGFCSLSADPDTGIGQVGQNGVHPDFKGQGYGAKQLEFILGELRRRGMTIAEVHTGLNDDGHAAARMMYERAGFEPLFDHRTYTMKL
jgi:GNAT superfamily N-acetyltransferase